MKPILVAQGGDGGGVTLAMLQPGGMQASSDACSASLRFRPVLLGQILNKASPTIPSQFQARKGARV